MPVLTITWCTYTDRCDCDVLSQACDPGTTLECLLTATLPPLTPPPSPLASAAYTYNTG